MPAIRGCRQENGHVWQKYHWLVIIVWFILLIIHYQRLNIEEVDDGGVPRNVMKKVYGNLLRPLQENYVSGQSTWAEQLHGKNFKKFKKVRWHLMIATRFCPKVPELWSFICVYVKTKVKHIVISSKQKLMQKCTASSISPPQLCTKSHVYPLPHP